jgi:hypothetical protein
MEGKRSRGISRQRWRDHVERDFKELEITNWREKTRDSGMESNIICRMNFKGKLMMVRIIKMLRTTF